jgi:cystathionine gamma-synthase
MKNGVGMVSFIMKDGAQVARRVAERMRIFTLPESLEGVESLIEVPAVMTHASIAGSPLKIDPGLVRLSVGLEHIDDLWEDLERAFGTR